MIESIFVFESTRARQRNAPLLRERERFLLHLLDEGITRARVRSIAAMLLNVVRVLGLNSLRKVSPEEIKDAGQRWLTEGSRRTRAAGKCSTFTFTYTATRWLGFLKLLDDPPKTLGPVETIVQEFAYFIRVTRGFSPHTVRSYVDRTSMFLKWVMDHHNQLSTVCIKDVDEFLETKRKAGCLPRTIFGFCNALRSFFKYAEMRGWNEHKIAPGIVIPKISRYDAPRGPAWRDIRRLLDSGFGTSPADLRAAAIFSLCAIYALRRCEIGDLRLSNFDWVNETFTVTRSKSGRVQQFPLSFEVGERILQYLQYGRPRCKCRNMFVTVRAPFRPIVLASIWTIIALRLKRLGIESEHFGAHSLRHSCATYLLSKGSSLKDIADFLGHRTMDSVSIYARYDVRSLRQVANFSLAGVK